MSTIDPSTIDPTKPTTGTALTADVRANEQATQTNLQAAKTDIEALETGKEPAGSTAVHDASPAAHGGVEAAFTAHDGAGGAAHPLATLSEAGFGPARSGSATEYLNGAGSYSTPPDATKVIHSDGVPMPQDRPILNFTGDGVALSDNAGTNSTDVSITNAQVNHVGGGAEIVQGRTGSDPVTLDLRTLVAGDASMVVTETADTIEFYSLGGGGGGEVNTASNAGTGGIGVTLPKSTFDLPFKSIFSADAAVVVADGGGNNRVELSLAPANISHTGLADIGSNSHAAIDSHIGDTSIHYAPSTLAGAGLVLNGSALDVGGGAGITVTASDIAVAFAGDGAAATAARSDHDHSTNQIGTTGLADSGVTNAKLADMAANTVKARGATSGVPVDLAEGAATDLGSFAPGDGLLGWKAGADLGRFTAIPGAVSPVTTKGDLYTYDTDDARLAVGTNGQLLYADSAEATGLRWGDAPAGTGDVTSALDTVDGEVQTGDATAKGIKGAGFQAAVVVRTDASVTIGEVGYPSTPTELTPAANTITPSVGGNGAYNVIASHADVLTIDVNAEPGEGAFSLFVPASVTGRTITPAPTQTIGSAAASVAQWLYMERTGSDWLAIWAGE